jgi:uncharacterized protein YybS (DUF2232 family)
MPADGRLQRGVKPEMITIIGILIALTYLVQPLGKQVFEIMIDIRRMTPFADAAGKFRNQPDITFKFTENDGAEISGDLRLVEAGFDTGFLQRVELKLFVVFLSDIKLLVKF